MLNGFATLFLACSVLLLALGSVIHLGEYAEFRQVQEESERSFQATLDSLNSQVDDLIHKVDSLSVIADTVIAYAERYNISASLSRKVYVAAKRHGIDLDMAYGLVWVESRFNPRALSWAGAIGLAQVMPATARDIRPGISIEEMYDPETNLDMGFSHLAFLLRYYQGDVKLALLGYNRGHGTVNRYLREGRDPSNGYEILVLGA